MTLEQRIHYFTLASMSQDDPREPTELVDEMTPSELLSQISDALEKAGVTFNTEQG